MENFPEAELSAEEQIDGKRKRKPNSLLGDLAESSSMSRSAPRQKPNKKEIIEDPNHPKVKRQLYQEELVRCMMEQEKRMEFSLRSHLQQLQPFISESSFGRLMQAAQTASIHNFPTVASEVRHLEQPASISTVTLRNYQIDGLSWLVDRYTKGVNCILADEMGLGKTLQTIAFFAFLKQFGVAGPHLVVVPLSVLFNWQAECRRFCPTLRIIRLHSTDTSECKRLGQLLHDVFSYDVAITTYEMVKSTGMQSILQRMSWRSVVMDEGHRIKNMATQISHASSLLRACFKLILTGTPVQNNLYETFCLLHYLNPKLFDNSQLFESIFALQRNSVQVDRKALDAAHYMLRPFVLRRLKTEVEQNLPPKLETLVLCPLSEMQRFWIKRLLLRDSMLFEKLATTETAGAIQQNGASAGIQRLTTEQQGEADKFIEASKNDSDGSAQVDGNEWKKLQCLLAQLRKASNHPYLFPGAEGPEPGDVTTEIVTASGKMVVLDKLLEKLQKKGHRVVLFSQYTRTLDIISDYLDWRGYSHCRLDGSTNRVMREVLINQFNKPGSPTFIFCLSTRAGGEGVNLFTADTVILFDSDWNPQVDIQAMARVHRIGQTKTVHIYRLVSQGSVEERIVQRAQKKLFLDTMVNRGSSATALELDKLKLRRMSSSSTTATASDDAADVSHEMDGAAACGENESIEDSNSLCRNSSITSLEDEYLLDGDEVEESMLMSALKFGWNSCLGSMGRQSSQFEISDSDIDALIDRNRGQEGHPSMDGGDNGNNQTRPAQSFSFSSSLKEDQQVSALAYEENAPFLDLRQFEGVEYEKTQLSGNTETRRLSDISSSWHAQKPLEEKRKSISRSEKVHVAGVGKVNVLKVNNYTLEEGEPSVYEREARGHEATVARKRDRQVAGIDYQNQSYCQICWTEGDLLQCSLCPASYHPRCVGLRGKPSWNWRCPHHQGCAVCPKKRSSAGFLFRCEMCSNSYCEDCLPQEHVILGACDRWAELGYRHPKSSCYIHCSQSCIEFAKVQQEHVASQEAELALLREKQEERRQTRKMLRRSSGKK